MWHLLPPISFNSPSSTPTLGTLFNFWLNSIRVFFLIGFNPLRSSPRENLLQPNWLLVGIGFGSLLFNLHWVFGDLSVVSRWASNGFPNQAPEPIPYG